MNWFQRYGIPGAYFVGLMTGWIYAFYFYPNLLKNEATPAPQWLLALAAITFLPIGYVISIVGQAVYLNWRRCFARWRSLRGWLGFHGAAMDKVGFCFPDVPGESQNESEKKSKDEAIVEARTLLLTASSNAPFSVDTHRYIRDWIARRMDVVAINQSVILSNLLGFLIALGVLLQDWKPWAFWALFIFIILVTLAMVCSIMVLRRQVIEVISGIYRTYR